MKQLLFLAMLALISAPAVAQKSFDEDVNSELDKMYGQSQSHNRPAQVQIVQVPAAQALPPAQNVQVPMQQVPVQYQQVPMQAAPVQYQQVPVQAQLPVQLAPQKQALTTVEASPLTESRADQMRKQREQTELLTEQKIVEKLEQSRMDDEKKRAEVLFGDKFNTLTNPQAAAPATPVPVVVPETKVEAPVPPAAPALDRDAVRQEVKAALDESKAKDEEKPVKKSYFSLLGGMDNYSNNHVQAQYSAGIGFGQKMNDRMLVEGQFNFSDAHVQQLDGYYTFNGFYPRITDMQAYQALIEGKYELLGGMFRPLVGAAASYTYRKYNDIQFGSSADTGYSNAIDVGLLAGADVTVSDSLALGLEVRYMWNLANQVQAQNSLTPLYNGSSSTTPENMGYLNMSLVGRMSF